MFRCFLLLILSFSASLCIADIVPCPSPTKIRNITLDRYYYYDSKLYCLMKSDTITIDNQEWHAELYSNVSLDLQHANEYIKKMNTALFDYTKFNSYGIGSCHYSIISNETNTSTPELYLVISTIAAEE